MSNVGRPKGEIRKEVISINVNPNLTKRLDKTRTNFDLSRSELAEKILTGGIMDLEDLVEKIADIKKDFKSKGIPFCEVCALQDAKGGTFSEDDVEKYTKLVFKKWAKKINRNFGQINLDGYQWNFSCPNHTGTQGFLFNEDEHQLALINKGEVKVERKAKNRGNV